MYLFTFQKQEGLENLLGILKSFSALSQRQKKQLDAPKGRKLIANTRQLSDTTVTVLLFQLHNSDFVRYNSHCFIFPVTLLRSVRYNSHYFTFPVTKFRFCQIEHAVIVYETKIFRRVPQPPCQKNTLCVYHILKLYKSLMSSIDILEEDYNCI